VLKAVNQKLVFSASFEFTTIDKISEDLVDLVNRDELICNPAKYGNDKKGCLQTTPPETCPCT